MLKASSLLYAIFVCLIVSLLCGSLIIIFNYQYRLKQQYFLEEELVRASAANFLQVLNKDGAQESEGEVQFADERFTTSYTISKWGFYNLVKTKTAFKKDTLYKVALIGSTAKKEKIALYLSDLDKPLHVGGQTRIKGDVKISKYGVKLGFITNNSYTGTKLVYGTVGVSEKRLPSLQLHDDNVTGNHKIVEVLLEELAGKSLYNSFHKPTVVVYADGVYDVRDISLSGNIILQSKDSVCIKNTAALNDILIKAPSVVFDDDFKGVVQVFAKRYVSLKKGVQLQYPSSIYIAHDSGDKIEILLEDKSKLAGGIVLTGDSYQSSLKRMVTIDKGALVIGDVYCYGKTQLKGKVIGTVYTDRFYLKTASSIYENHIVGGEINRLELPDNFIGLPLFLNKNTNYELIKEL
ncbi:MAG: hypothetical protein COA88_13025 [Kordia sp.]|nr:MAG: hypothetical protein COA88_13025 [Kordia sp.]